MQKIYTQMKVNVYMGGLSYYSNKLGIFVLLYVHMVDYSTTFEVF